MQRTALCATPWLFLSAVAFGHEEASTLGMPRGFVAQATLSGSYRTEARVKSTERWIIPGFLMGGEALPMPRGFHLDEAMLSASYGTDASYAFVKVGQHVGAEGLEIEHAYVGQRLLDQTVLEFGRMSSVMTPYQSPHASQTPFSDSLLVYDAFWGRQYNDLGLRLRTLFPGPGLEAGLEVWQGDRFPAERKEGPKGAFDLYVTHSLTLGDFASRLGAFYFQGEADTRKDDRYSSEHNHGLDTTTIPVYWFTGQTKVHGAHLALDYGQAVKVGVAGEIQWSSSEGELRDATRLSPLESKAKGQWGSVFLQTETQLAALRYERLQFDNQLTGAAATTLAATANLLGEKDPYRISAAYNWQWNRELRLRGEWLRDFTTAKKKDLGVVGFVWTYRVSQDVSTLDNE